MQADKVAVCSFAYFLASGSHYHHTLVLMVLSLSHLLICSHTKLFFYYFASMKQWYIAHKITRIYSWIGVRALSKTDARKTDALDQWCLRRILDVRCYHRVSNRKVRCMTEQPPLTAIIQKRRLMLFGHLARMDETADTRRILTGVHQSDWSRPVGRPYTSWMATLKSDLSLHNLTLRMLQSWPWISWCRDYW